MSGIFFRAWLGVVLHVALPAATSLCYDSPEGRAAMVRDPAFDRYIGIDYSGAETPTSSLKGLRVYEAAPAVPPYEVHPPPSPRKYWTRRGIHEWLTDRLSEDRPTLVGIDHAFSFPLVYFEKYGLPLGWTAFLEDFCRHWPTDGDHVYVDFVRYGSVGNGVSRSGDPRWRRLAETRTRAKSVFHFDVQGSVAKSTHAGLPWLFRLRLRFGGRLHFWPFDGWEVPEGKSAVVEVYPALWNQGLAQAGCDSHQRDAHSIMAWMRQAECNGSLAAYLNPRLEETERKTAEIEGWILGVA